MLTDPEIKRYSRQILLQEIGIEGQGKLKQSSVLVIGAGGLSSPVLLYLAAAGVGKIGVVDYDRVEESNLHRQVIHSTQSVGEMKVDSAEKTLKAINPFIQVETFGTKIHSRNAIEMISRFDAVVDGSDNFPTRYLLNDVCVWLKKPLIYGAVYRFEGQVSVFNHLNGPCYRCLFPEPPKAGTVLNCAEIGVLGVLPGIIGSIQANEAVKVLLNFGYSLSGRLLLFDALKMKFDEMKFRKNPNCKICGENPEITGLIDYEVFCGVKPDSNKEISASELKAKLKSPHLFHLIDVRENHEVAVSKIEGSIHIPLGNLNRQTDYFLKESEIIIYCQSGIRSGKALELLEEHGFQNVKHLKGGMNGFR